MFHKGLTFSTIGSGSEISRNKGMVVLGDVRQEDRATGLLMRPRACSEPSEGLAYQPYVLAFIVESLERSETLACYG